MYQVKFLTAGTESSDFDDWIIQGVQATPFEPREGRTYIFRDRKDSIRGRRFTVTTVVIDQTYDNPETAVARVYLKQVG